MRIEKIELIGFKSFADKTSFVLHPGMTCIVGPNGCGKSNIVDAFRWVLGEQSAKSLRGEKMEEVIFNGSSLKKPKGMSEVSMVVSGLNGPGSGNGQGSSDLTTVTRRLYRSGESEYMINKNTCRLKDIRDIFLDTGLDFKSYSILEQGRIGEIINSKPLDRRFIIEEVAGVMKYKVRKAEALSKLESSRLNLVRINDIISEVKKQINILDRLAKKAERYKKLSSQMHAIELKIARREYQQLIDANALVMEEYAGLKEKEAVMGAEMSQAENTTESRRVVLLEKEKALELVQKDFQLMERDISEIDRSIAVGRNDIENFGQYNNRLVVQSGEAETRIAELLLKCEELEAAAGKIRDEIGSNTEMLKEKTESFRAVEDELADKEEQIEDKRRTVFRISEDLSGLKNELARQQSTFEALERRQVTSLRESEDSRKILAEIEHSIDRMESEIHGNHNEVLLLKEKREILLRDLSAGKSRLEALSGNLATYREDLASSVSRLNSLKEIVLDSPTWEVIAAATDVSLLSAVADVIEVEAAYEKAIEGVLSEKAAAFVLNSNEDIEKSVLCLRDKDIVRTAFVPIHAHGIVPPEENTSEGVLGRAVQFVKVKDGYSSVAQNLLGSVLIVRDLKTAFSLSALHGNPYTCVTTEGVVVEPSGTVVVGGEKGIFRRKREIRELEDVIESKKTEIETVNRDIQAINTLIMEKEAGVKDVESSVYSLEKEISLSRLTVENYTEEKEKTSRKLSYLNLETEETVREKDALMKIIEEVRKKIEEVEARKNEAEEETQMLQEGIAQKKSEIEESRSYVTDLRLMIASSREKAESLRNEFESSRKTLEELRLKKEELRAELETVTLKTAQREAEIAGHETRLRRLVADADAVRQTISLKKEEIEKESEDLIGVEQGLKALRQQMSAVMARVSELDVLKAEHKLRIENISLNIRNNFGMEIDTVEFSEVSKEEEDALVELRQKIQEMGPVNLGTLDEYEELRTRYEFMTKQQEDLNKSISELEEAITKINSTTRKKLREAFDMLAAKFREVFTTLFGGGRAELVLTDDNNILESGIEIIAQPPGKKLQNIHLLSGGEKALTALSIQFASFLIKPTPLCILDEADAPLDESNTERYARMLNELSNETQFIVVTHNRTTMSVAQHLYGITMEEAGVSKVISMQLAEV